MIPTLAEFTTYSQWAGILTLICLLITILAFIFQWGLRFRLVGATSLMGVLTLGLFGLSLGLSTRSIIPGALRYSLVYDNGASQAVISLPPQVTPSQVEATLQQAANDLYSFGRIGQGGNQMHIRARTVIHPSPGTSQPLYLGEVKRALAQREDQQMDIQIFTANFAHIPPSPAQE